MGWNRVSSVATTALARSALRHQARSSGLLVGTVQRAGFYTRNGNAAIASPKTDLSSILTGWTRALHSSTERLQQAAAAKPQSVPLSKLTDNFNFDKERAVAKDKVRLVPEWYILPRRSIPRTIALYSFLTVAGVGAGMLVEAWIKQQVENDTAILWRKDEGVGRNSNPDPRVKP